MYKQKYNGHRLRIGRCSESNRIYHLTTTTIHRHPYFSDFQLGRIVVQALRYQHDQGKVHSLAFVIMPDHFHWLVQLGSDTSLAKLMSTVKGWSTTRIQQIVSSKNIWQRGYFDHALRSDEDMQSVARYIVANPLRAGLVENIGEYPLWDAVWL
ncbi:MAG: transposase [Gammaproteobacteria bacterium SG8_11]|nr:MAG: transposase [Gammaproteobacteria bacterium SG8_11]